VGLCVWFEVLLFLVCVCVGKLVVQEWENIDRLVDELIVQRLFAILVWELRRYPRGTHLWRRPDEKSEFNQEKGSA